MVQVGDLPSISVIVPVMNMAFTVRDLLESLMLLDYDKDKLEIVFVDGDSKDRTKEIITEYPVKLIQQEGKGLNAARNTGIKYSKGEILAYTDGDCIVPPWWLKAIAHNFVDPSVSFVGGTMEGFRHDSLLSAYMDETMFQVTPGFNYRMEGTDLRLLDFPAGANMAFRRTALARVRFFDENINFGFDDLQPIEAMGFKGFRIVLDPDVRVKHQHRTSLTALLKQHFNYGRGGTLLIVHKRSSLLASWFAGYLLFTTFAFSIFVFMMYLWVKTRHPLPFQLGFGTLGIFFLTVFIYYLPVSLKTRKLWKMFVYPVLDILRGFSFTLGGIYQLTKSVENKSEN